MPPPPLAPAVAGAAPPMRTAPVLFAGADSARRRRSTLSVRVLYRTALRKLRCVVALRFVRPTRLLLRWPDSARRWGRSCDHHAATADRLGRAVHETLTLKAGG